MYVLGTLCLLIKTLAAWLFVFRFRFHSNGHDLGRRWLHLSDFFFNYSRRVEVAACWGLNHLWQGCHLYAPGRTPKLP